MKRTAADFARDATLDVWTFTTSDGRELTPRPRAFFTYDEQLEVANNDVRWAEVMTGASEVPDDLESSFLMMLKLRFSPPGVYIAALEEARTQARLARRDGADEQTGKPADQVELPDFDAFWAEVKNMPLGEPDVDPKNRLGLHGLIAELDGFYRSPEPASAQETAAANADSAGDAAGKLRGVSTS